MHLSGRLQESLRREVLPQLGLLLFTLLNSARNGTRVTQQSKGLLKKLIPEPIGERSSMFRSFLELSAVPNTSIIQELLYKSQLPTHAENPFHDRHLFPFVSLFLVFSFLRVLRLRSRKRLRQLRAFFRYNRLLLLGPTKSDLTTSEVRDCDLLQPINFPPQVAHHGS